MPARRSISGLDIRIVVPGLPIAAPDPFAVALGGSETAGLQLAAELARQGHDVTVVCGVAEPFTWRGVRLARRLPPAELATTSWWCSGRRSTCGPGAGARRFHECTRSTSLQRPNCGATCTLPTGLPPSPRSRRAKRRGLAPELAEDRFLSVRNDGDVGLVAAASRARPSAARSGSCTRPRRPRRGPDILLGDILPRILTAALRATLHAKAAATAGWARAVRGPRPTC
jgi:hypothetical protein